MEGNSEETGVRLGVIDNFEGRYRFLSNFFVRELFYDGILYPSSEHAYQAAKSLDFDVRQRIARCSTPGTAKKAGKQVKLRPNFDTLKGDIMFEIVLKKFAANSDLREKLVKTSGYSLVEGNTWDDTYWGVCNGVGQNQLGIILMRVRDLLS